MRMAVLAVVPCGSAACYYYRPLESQRLVPGVYLAATITDTGADHLSRTIGPDVSVVRGRLVTSDPEGLTLAVLGVSLHHGENVTWKGEHVTVSREYLSGLQQRHLSKGRTVLVASGALLSLITAYTVVRSLGIASGRGGGTNVPK
jgi:hypothetical protein